MTTARSVSNICDEWCRSQTQDDIDKAIRLYGFNLRVMVFPDIPPRDPMFDYMKGFGVGKFDEIFDGTLSRMTETWLMSFPEAHCTVDETSKLIKKMVDLNKKYNWGLKQLDIITNSPYIISDSLQGSVFILHKTK